MFKKLYFSSCFFYVIHPRYHVILNRSTLQPYLFCALKNSQILRKRECNTVCCAQVCQVRIRKWAATMRATGDCRLGVCYLCLIIHSLCKFINIIYVYLCLIYTHHIRTNSGVRSPHQTWKNVRISMCPERVSEVERSNMLTVSIDVMITNARDSMQDNCLRLH